MPDFSSYLESVRRHYEQWWSLYTLTDAEGRSKAKTQGTLFDFGLMVQTIAPKADRMEEDRSQTETIERFGVLDGLRKYAGEHVLLVGRPGSGKSTALARLLLEESEKGDRIPVLVELRYWNEQGVLGLIQGFLRSLPTQVGLSPVEIHRTTLEELLRSNKFLLLIDGLNELPSEAARQDVLRFRREFPKVAIVFTTRDLSLGGDFGIEKRLEMQPLTETQMRSFVTAYIPEQSEAMLRQLGTRLREFGSTPLLLWMLCGLFRQTGEIPANLGEVFRVFTQGYEQRLKADVVLEGDRRWWAGLLQALAARMMIGDGSVEFQVAIDRAEVEAIFTGFLRDRETLAAGAARKGLEDLLRHHLIQTNGSQVEFRHQLIQEYYAAEWLLGRVGCLDDATLQQEFLNYLKWTEPVALMLALVDDEALAVRVVERALEVDLMLGARLAGEVRSSFQERCIKIIKCLNSLNWLKIKLLRSTKSDYVVNDLIHLICHGNQENRVNAARALAEIKSEFAVNSLMQRIEIESGETCVLLTSTLCEILGRENGSKSILLNSKNDLAISLVENERIAFLNHQSSYIPKLRAKNDDKLSHDEMEHVFKCHPTSKAIVLQMLGDRRSSQVLPILFNILDNPLQLIKPEDLSDGFIGYLLSTTIESIGKCGNASCLPRILSYINHPHSGVRASVFTAMRLIGSSIDDNILLSGLNDESSNVRSSVLETIASIKDFTMIPFILKGFHDNDLIVRHSTSCSINILSTEKSGEFIPELKIISAKDYGGTAHYSIKIIQEKCKFYNYEIQQQAKPRKADRTSLEGGGGDPFAKIENKLEAIDRRIQRMPEQPSTISISGGTFNGPVNLASNHGHQPTTIIDTQNNYFGADEALLQQITDLQTFITEIESQHPNLQTEDQANTVVQTKLDQLQTQNPDRWQKLRQQMQILKAQLFNPERHAQAIKATVVEVTKAKWEESLIVKAIVTYLDKFSETPEKGA
jgi:HEAT repeat protein/energy-coupling factor transporter ATP-binding protein EcfA2